MDRRLRAWLAALLCCILPAAVQAQAPEEFQKRRQAVREAMDPGSVLVLRSPQTGGEKFRQDSNLYYLTGLDRPGVSLILAASQPASAPAGAAQPGGVAAGAAPMMRLGVSGPGELLFLPPAVTTGPIAIPRGGSMPLPPPVAVPPGFSTARPSTEFDRTFESLLLSSPPILYLDGPRSRSLSAPLTADEQLLRAARDRGATLVVRPATALIAPLRVIKSPAEIELIQRATDITAQAHKEVMRAAKAGMYEYQIQAIIEYTFALNGALRQGFASIVGSGPNGTILHWSENTRKTESGDLVVMDIGAEHGMYSSDITRTIPISGRFTERQRQVYEIVLRANQEAIAMVGPGVNMRDVGAKASDVLAQGLITLGIIKDRKELGEYYYHGLSHQLGLQVHDVGGLGVLQPGMVITIEPGLYFRKENFGIRVEDDVLVTPTGRTVLSAAAPKTVGEIESLMKEDGLDIEKQLVAPRPSPKGTSARVLVQTSLGNIEIEVDGQHAAETAANFLKYVDAGHYDGGQFHRTATMANQPNDAVKIEVIQASVNPGRETEAFPPIALERTNRTGLLHKDGTVSMARGGADTATSSFFICVGNQRELDFGGKRNADGQGFAAFGRVVGGMDVVRRIHAAPNSEAQRLTPPIRIVKVMRIAKAPSEAHRVM
jgi:Xaa-Pro aminopeptidase